MPLIRKGQNEAIPQRRNDREVTMLLSQGNEDERWMAARTLASHPGAVEAFASALETETSERVRIAMFTSLARIASPASVMAVLPWLRSDNAGMRTSALDALRAMPEAASFRLPELLRDPDADVRLLSCELARGLASNEAAALLCDLLDTEQNANVCAAAVEVLSEIGGPMAEQALRRCADRFAQEPFLLFAIKMALQVTGSQTQNPRD